MMNMLELIKRRCGIAELITVYDEDISAYMDDAKSDMIDSGVPQSVIEGESASVATAVTLYVKANMADDRADAERYMELYRSKVFRLTLKEGEQIDVEPVDRIDV